MAKKSNLTKARISKNDEFHTRLEDIENELKHYKEHFADKIVYCNADDPRVSNFFHYFSYNFKSLNLKKLITTCYKNQNMDLFSLQDHESAIALVYEGEKDNGRVPTVENIGVIELKHDGDFRSPEAIAFLKEADVVVTNPPFSLFRDYINQLVEYEKKFVVIGNMNAISYKEIFPLIKDNKIWTGYKSFGGGMDMIVPDSVFDEDSAGAFKVDDEGNYIKNIMGVIWFTNIETQKRNEELILYKKYNPIDYPTYDNYNAIDVSKVSDIPKDYDGVMGVPITFLHKYNPDQFEILGINTSYSDELNHELVKTTKKYKNAQQISKTGKISNGNKINDSSTIINTEKPNETYYLVDGIEGYITITYARLFIRNKKVVE